MSDLLQRLKTEVLIASGSIETNLTRMGYDQRGNASWWVITHHDAYQDLLRTFLNVGCDIIVAGVSTANRLKLKRHGLQGKTRDINYTITKLAREITPKNCYLVFNLSASELFLPPVGGASADEVYESYVEQVVIAEDIGVDFFRVGGSDIEQTGLAIKAVRDNSKLPLAGLLHSINPTPKGFRSIMGVDPATAARKFQELGVDIVGMMCGEINYEETTVVLKEMGAACNKYLYVRPNAGTPQLINGKTVHPATPEQMAKEAPNWVAAGAKIIGGCCGTTPEHIARVAAMLK
jgi:5-methyltetrahydrofolate--homocysteine methyltransferase